MVRVRAIVRVMTRVNVWVSFGVYLQPLRCTKSFGYSLGLGLRLGGKSFGLGLR